ncbi:alternate F1F0 ATPase, F1 subunit alpha [Methylobacter sp. YRD-M1]|uniref:alternate F1F0 ATPase, F1 subunit alpha n=1 Tax=Methylobacter sp. YRD-M1 TaxID=2911520 RepID=UPI00227AFB68|nr:alternate F1F0 ATPase, F1 subunit alpha [Methylobacter sp. YRD-M1]WAK03933.1 alternate F1F0 ATPase, F1 subunit alpha [Methylobacter sp. YRD-M1]
MNGILEPFVRQASAHIDRVITDKGVALHEREIGRLMQVGTGVARVQGLPGTRAMELLRFENGVMGMAFNLDPDDIGVVLLGEKADLSAGSRVERTGRVVDIPVGGKLLGRVVDALGRPLDDAGALETDARWPIEREARPIIERAPVSVPLQTGIKVIDALIPIGRGQRQLILGDRQTGKTAVAVDTILNQTDKNVICVYCAIGQRGSAVAKVIERLRAQGALKNCVVLVAAGETTPGVQYIAPYAATSIAEWFMMQGEDVLVVYDDLTRHAHAYRELSLLLRRPPGREAYPGDIFYLHSRLLERATHLKPEHGGGSLTALPVIETQAQNIAAYIPTNLISITDGQVYLSPVLFQKGELPAVDVGKSVSRVGGKAQLPGYLDVSGQLRLAYSQFEELETFARFGTRLDEATRRSIERGRRVREVLKQPESRPLSAFEQIAMLLALNDGLFDAIALSETQQAGDRLTHELAGQLQSQRQKILAGEKLSDEDKSLLLDFARGVLDAGAESTWITH